MKIYMDVCCLNRPFDDLSQNRVYLEAEAILSFISDCESGKASLISSGILDYELSRITNADKAAQIYDIYANATIRATLTENAEKRAAYFRENGIKLYDSLHLALAEQAEADVFLSTDDNLIKLANKLEVSTKVFNPLKWLMEGSQNG